LKNPALDPRINLFSLHWCFFGCFDRDCDFPGKYFYGLLPACVI